MTIQREMMITFGTGDVIITVVRHEEVIDSIGFVASDRTYPIGSGLADGVPTVTLSELDLMLRFTDPASVDVVIEALELIKENLIKAVGGRKHPPESMKCKGCGWVGLPQETHPDYDDYRCPKCEFEVHEIEDKENIS